MSGGRVLALILAAAAVICMVAQTFAVRSGFGGPRAAAAWGVGSMVMLLAAAVVVIREIRRAL
jgi:hypothetical protein